MLRKLYTFYFFNRPAQDAGPRSEFDQTSLDKYAHQTDQSFGYEIKTEEYENYFIHKIKMTSQTYLSIQEVNRPTWAHWLKVIEPRNLRSMHLCLSLELVIQMILLQFLPAS